ncbi:hypothetical protein BH18VER1_BH18VER1_16670 [soil metagenome]
MHKLVELPIHDVAFGGKGVGRSAGKVVFVPFTIDGESVCARIVREKKQLAEAELHSVIDASEHRTEAQCPYFGACGGCAYQHINYEHQLTIKAKQVEQTVRRIARHGHVSMRPIIPSPAAYGYRNRITVHAEQGVVGYYRRESHQLIDVEQCPIATPEVNTALADLRARNPRDGHYSLRAHGGPLVFAQTNDAVADALANLVETLLGGGGELLIDAYCGAGFFTKRLARKFRRVVGIEWNRHAVAAAQEKVTPNETYIAGDVDRELESQLFGCEPAATCVLVDPPAEGLGANTRRTLIDSRPHTVVYVSCNPATLGRDLGELSATYKIDSVTPLDMFPQTTEIEAVAALSLI